jgi:hypothetical protein
MPRVNKYAGTVKLIMPHGEKMHYLPIGGPKPKETGQHRLSAGGYLKGCVIANAPSEDLLGVGRVVGEAVTGPDRRHLGPDYQPIMF